MAKWEKKKSESKYSHICKDGIVYLGLPKYMSEEIEKEEDEEVRERKKIEIEDQILCFDNPYIEYNDLYISLLQLDLEDRMDFITAIEEYMAQRNKESNDKNKKGDDKNKKGDDKNKKGDDNNDNNRKPKFNKLYWDIIVDFIFVYYGHTLYDIAGEIIKYWKSNNIEFFYDQKGLYDCLYKVYNIKLSPVDSTLEVINTMLKIYGISADILKTGKGDWIAVGKKDTFRLKLQIAVIDKRVDPQLSDFINALIEQKILKK